MSKLLNTISIDESTMSIELAFNIPLSLSLEHEAGSDKLSTIKKTEARGQVREVVEYDLDTIRSNGTPPCTSWTVTYTEIRREKKTGTILDPDELVVVIETRETVSPLRMAGKKKIAKKKVAKKKGASKVTKTASKPAAKKKTIKKK